MKNRGKILLSILLAAVMVPMVAMTAKAAEPSSSKKPTDATITVKIDPSCTQYGSQNYGVIVYDLYEIDDETLEELNDEYKADPKMDLEARFKKLCRDEVEKRIKRSVNVGGTTNTTTVDFKVNPDYENLPLNEAQKVEGTYLLIAKGLAKDGQNEHVDTFYYDIKVANADSSSSETQVASCIRMGANYFTISPQIVTSPIKYNNGKIVRLDSDPGEWQDNQIIYLKMLVDPEFGEIEIWKDMLAFPVAQENATCVFKVAVYYPDDETLYSEETYGMIFTKSDFDDATDSINVVAGPNKTATNTIKVGGIPIGSKVTVTEVYSGASYVGTVEYPKNNTLIVDRGTGKNLFKFKNTPYYNRGGGGLVNRFEYVDDGSGISWEWTSEKYFNYETGKYYDNVDTTNGRLKTFLQQMVEDKKGPGYIQYVTPTPTPAT